MTAHELARKLLEGGDYDVVLGASWSEKIFDDFKVKSVGAVIINGDSVTSPAIVLELDNEEPGGCIVGSVHVD